MQLDEGLDTGPILLAQTHAHRPRGDRGRPLPAPGRAGRGAPAHDPRWPRRRHAAAHPPGLVTSHSRPPPQERRWPDRLEPAGRGPRLSGAWLSPVAGCLRASRGRLVKVLRARPEATVGDRGRTTGNRARGGRGGHRRGLRRGLAPPASRGPAGEPPRHAGRGLRVGRPPLLRRAIRLTWPPRPASSRSRSSRRSSAAGTTVAEALATRDAEALPARDRALLHELVLGTLRRRGALDHALAKHLDRPIARVDPPLLRALRLGAHQVLNLRVPDRAAVAESVDLARAANPRGAGFVNAVLRGLAREGAPDPPDPTTDPKGWLTTAGSLPEWLAERWIANLGPAAAVARARAQLDAPPTAFRLNPRVPRCRGAPGGGGDRGDGGPRAGGPAGHDGTARRAAGGGPGLSAGRRLAARGPAGGRTRPEARRVCGARGQGVAHGGRGRGRRDGGRGGGFVPAPRGDARPRPSLGRPEPAPPRRRWTPAPASRHVRGGAARRALQRPRHDCAQPRHPMEGACRRPRPPRRRGRAPSSRAWPRSSSRGACSSTRCAPRSRRRPRESCSRSSTGHPAFTLEPPPSWAAAFASGPFLRTAPERHGGDAFFAGLLRRA